MNVKKYIPLFRNKYFLATLALLVILVVFEDINVYRLYKYRIGLHKLQAENEHKAAEIEDIKIKTTELTTDPEALEVFARETYRMKKNDEVVFLFLKDTLSEE